MRLMALRVASRGFFSRHVSAKDGERVVRQMPRVPFFYEELAVACTRPAHNIPFIQYIIEIFSDIPSLPFVDHR